MEVIHELRELEELNPSPTPSEIAIEIEKITKAYDEPSFWRRMNKRIYDRENKTVLTKNKRLRRRVPVEEQESFMKKCKVTWLSIAMGTFVVVVFIGLGYREIYAARQSKEATKNLTKRDLTNQSEPNPENYTDSGYRELYQAKQSKKVDYLENYRANQTKEAAKNRTKRNLPDQIEATGENITVLDYLEIYQAKQSKEPKNRTKRDLANQIKDTLKNITGLDYLEISHTKQSKEAANNRTKRNVPDQIEATSKNVTSLGYSELYQAKQSNEGGKNVTKRDLSNEIEPPPENVITAKRYYNFLNYAARSLQNSKSYQEDDVLNMPDPRFNQDLPDIFLSNNETVALVIESVESTVEETIAQPSNIEDFGLTADPRFAQDLPDIFLSNNETFADILPQMQTSADSTETSLQGNRDTDSLFEDFVMNQDDNDNKIHIRTKRI